MITFLVLATILLLLGLAGWRLCRRTPSRLASLPWLGLAAVLGLCALFDFCSHLAPAVLTGHIEPVAERAVEGQPLLGVLGQHPWLILGVAVLCTGVPYLLRLNGFLLRRRVPPSDTPSPRLLVRDL